MAVRDVGMRRSLPRELGWSHSGYFEEGMNQSRHDVLWHTRPVGPGVPDRRQGSFGCLRTRDNR